MISNPEGLYARDPVDFAVFCTSKSVPRLGSDSVDGRFQVQLIVFLVGKPTFRGLRPGSFKVHLCYQMILFSSL
jgi:hypothetical protein